MNTGDVALTMSQPQLAEALAVLDESQLNALPFGVIAFGRDGTVGRYNHFEVNATGLSRDYVVGKQLFTQIAQCMNNFLVAQVYEDAWASERVLDSTIDYVLTWRMKPTKVKLRMLWTPGCEFAYVVLSPRTPL